MKRSYLRIIAVTLIALPEPFTTPFGIVLLLVSFFLPRRYKDNLRNLEDLVRRYQSYSKTTGLGRSAVLTRPAVFHPLNRIVLSPQAGIAGGSVGTMSAGSKKSLKAGRRYFTSPPTIKRHEYIGQKTDRKLQYHYPTDNHHVNNKITHHVLQNSGTQYKSEPVKPEPVLHHNLKKTWQPVRAVFHSKLKPLGTDTQIQKAVHHSIKR